MNEKMRLVLMGGGGHCKSVLDTALRTGLFDEIVITDYNMPAGTKILNCAVIGNDCMLPELFMEGFRYAFVTVGNIKSTAIRHKLYDMARKQGFLFPNIIDPSSQVSPFARLGRGNFIGKNVVVNADVLIEDMAIINTGAIVEHECRIGSFTHVSVGTTLCGNVTIGHDSFIGAGSTVIQGTVIGSNTLIGAGSLVLRDVPDQMTKKGLIN